jgi:hypothetical protein
MANLYADDELILRIPAAGGTYFGDNSVNFGVANGGEIGEIYVDEIRAYSNVPAPEPPPSPPEGAIPEPSTMVLFGSSLLGLGRLASRRKR